MSLQSATPVTFALPRHLARPCCPRCGETQYAPERSEFVREGVIQYAWSCDGCDQEFRTMVEVGFEAA